MAFRSQNHSRMAISRKRKREGLNADVLKRLTDTFLSLTKRSRLTEAHKDFLTGMDRMQARAARLCNYPIYTYHINALNNTFNNISESCDSLLQNLLQSDELQISKTRAEIYRTCILTILDISTRFYDSHIKLVQEE